MSLLLMALKGYCLFALRLLKGNVNSTTYDDDKPYSRNKRDQQNLLCQPTPARKNKFKSFYEQEKNMEG